MRGARLDVVIGVVCVVLIGVVGFGWFQYSRGLPDDLTDLRAACEGRSYEDAAAFSDQAPHPVVIFLSSDGDDFGDATPESDEFGFEPNGNTAPYQPTDTTEVQLVACGVIVEEGPSGPDCEYVDPDGGEGFSVPVHGATYEVTLYELRTHEKVGQVRVETMPDTFGVRCPSLLERSAAPDRFLDDIDINRWILSLEKWVG